MVLSEGSKQPRTTVHFLRGVPLSHLAGFGVQILARVLPSTATILHQE